MFKAKQRVGKYRIERRLYHGAFAAVYRAMDTIEGRRVALKVPHASMVDDELLRGFRHEVRVTSRLEHPHILPLKDASFIEGHFVMVFPLGEETLADRLQRRMAWRTVLEFAGQMLDAVAYAHRHRVMHCDIKPENFILFPGNSVRLTDFGIAKIAMRTVQASGSGTIGYMAPEQAMGKPSLRSDVFSLGLVLYRMISGHLPEWPFTWPPSGHVKLRRRAHPELVALLRKAINVGPRKRFRDADQMFAAFRRIRTKAIRYANQQRARR